MGCSKQGLLRRERFENSRNYFDRSFKNVVGGEVNIDIFFCSTFFSCLADFYFFVWQIKIFSTVAWRTLVVLSQKKRTKNFDKGKSVFSRRKPKHRHQREYFEECIVPSSKARGDGTLRVLRYQYSKRSHDKPPHHLVACNTIRSIEYWCGVVFFVFVFVFTPP